MCKNRKKPLALLILISFALSLLNVQLPAGAAETVPTITGLSPAEYSRAGGQLMTITGSNLSSTSLPVSVRFGDITATPSSVSSTQIKVTIPASATYGTVQVRVVKGTGEEALLSNALSFQYISTPVVTDVDPASDTTIGGATVFVSGSEFNQPRVWFGSVEATVISNTASQITVTVPPNSLGTKAVKVTNEDGGTYTLNDAFTYNPSNPALSSISPTKGGYKTVVTVNGSGFHRDAQVLFGGQGVATTYVSSTMLKAEAPSGEIGSVAAITVRNPDGQETPIAQNFTYIIMPVIKGLSSTSGWAGDTITVQGLNFEQLSPLAVSIDNATVSIVGGLVDADPAPEKKIQIKIESVSLPQGVSSLVVPLTIYNGSDPDQRASVKFTLAPANSPPVITGIAPTSGKLEGGDTLEIYGSNFRILGSDDSDIPAVTIGGVIAPVKRDANNVPLVAADKITVLTPANSAGPKLVTVTNPDGQSAEWEWFTYQMQGNLPRITSVSPNRGPFNVNMPITISGGNFPSQEEIDNGDAVLEVTIGGIAVLEPQVVKGEEVDYITCSTPIGSIPDGETESAQDVRVQVTRGQEVQVAVLTAGYTYYLPASNPVIYDVIWPVTSDNTVPLKGGVAVEVYVEDLRSPARLYIGSIDPANQVLPPSPYTELQVTQVDTNRFKVVGIIPGMEVPGLYDLILENNDGAIAIKKGGIYYKGTTMRLDSVTPDRGPVSGGTRIVIHGDNLDEDYQDETQVILKNDLGEKPATIVVFQKGKIEAITRDSQEGWHDVVVSNRYGDVVKADAFYYEPSIVKPVITAIQTEGGTAERPAVGPVTGGTQLTIAGEDFQTGARVTIGGVEASEVRVNSVNEIVATTPPGEPGYQPVMVINPSGGFDTWGDTAEEIGFFYYSSPKINQVVPDKGTTKGGQIITLHGEQFYSSMKIYVGDQLVEAEDQYLVDQNTVLFKLPPKEEEAPYQTFIRVENEDGGSAQADFTYVDTGEVLVYNVVPNIGPMGGGTTVRISGLGFNKGATVYFGWQKASVQEVKYDGTEIVAKTPANAVGWYDVTVTNLDGSTGILADAFRYTNPLNPPTIADITPAYGPASGGNYAYITGSGFFYGVEVYFGNTPVADGDILLIDSGTIRVKVPPGSTGSVDVWVINADGGMAIKLNGYTYRTVFGNPQILSIYPNQLPTDGNIPVTIVGSGFLQGVKVYLDGQLITPISYNHESQVIRFTAPPHAAGVVDVTVINVDGSMAQAIGGITYIGSEVSLKIKKVDPNEGSVAGGTLVTIYADPDDPVEPGYFPAEGNVVYFGLNEATIQEVYADRIIVLAPPGPAGLVNVTVANFEYPGSYTLPNAFRYVSSDPKITAVTPSQGSYLGGTLVTIAGEDFSVGAAVYFGDHEVTEEMLITPTSIVVSTPPADLKEIGEKLKVRVVNPDGRSAEFTGFTYLYPDSSPHIIAVEPNKGSTLGGMPVVITGTDFRAGAKVVIGGKEATVVVVNDKLEDGTSSITILTPAHTEGAKDVVVVNYDGASDVLTGGFTYEKPLSFPEITSITPSQGTTLGRTMVTISGTYFKEGAQVWFGVNPATNVTVVDYRTITLETPAGEEGYVDVLLLNPDMGQAVKTRGFKYITVTPPKLTAVVPNEGPTTGGTTITITGENIQTGAQVYVGDAKATDAVVNKGEITAVTPAGEEGWQEVRVVNPDGGWAGLENGFKYYKPRTEPELPLGLSAVAKDYQTIELSWEEVEFANNYEIYISTSSSGNYRFLDQLNGTDRLAAIRGKMRYYATNLQPDTRYYFKVRAVNELGYSQQTVAVSARTDDDVPDDYGERTEVSKIIFTSGSGQAEAVVSNYQALKSAGYIIDFRSQGSGKTVQKVSFQAAALVDARDDITIVNDYLTLHLDPLSILHPSYWDQSSKRLKEVYSNLYITDLGQREAEQAAKSLPRGKTIISRVLAVSWESQEGKEKTQQSSFYPNVAVHLLYQATSLSGGKAPELYIYNEATGKWETVQSSHLSSSRTVQFNLSKACKFMVVY